MSLVYYFDVGNTRAKFWSCRDGELLERVAISHGGDVAALPSMLSSGFAVTPDAVLGASVLDAEANAVFAAACVRRWQHAPVIARSSRACAGVTSGYDEPERLGVDRWLGLIAVAGRGRDVCVLDCGTAITLDVLRADGRHLGGYILPGLSMMADSLLRATRRVRFDPLPPELAGVALGHGTGEAVTHGALAAVVALASQVVAGLPGCELVLTGGDAARISPHVSGPHTVEPDLLLRGLQRYFADAGIN